MSVSMAIKGPRLSNFISTIFPSRDDLYRIVADLADNMSRLEDIACKLEEIQEKTRNEAKTITNNFYGDHARCNQQGTDASRTIIRYDFSVKIKEIEVELESLTLTREQTGKAHQIVASLRKELKTSAPRPEKIRKLLGLLPQTANITTICSFILDIFKT